MARGLLIGFPIAVGVFLAGIGAHVMVARADHVWAFALLPIAALVLGPRTRVLVVAAVCELAALLPLHALVTLVRAARLEGG
jgi:hypothetical protein